MPYHSALLIRASTNGDVAQLQCVVDQNGGHVEYMILSVY